RWYPAGLHLPHWCGCRRPTAQSLLQPYWWLWEYESSPLPAACLPVPRWGLRNNRWAGLLWPYQYGLTPLHSRQHSDLCEKYVPERHGPAPEKPPARGPGGRRL